MPNASEFYRSPAGELLQGDIFDDVPHVFLRPPISVVRGPISAPGKRQIYGVYPFDRANPVTPTFGGAFDFKKEEGEKLAVACHLTRAIVLSHECTIENDGEAVQIALVRPVRVPTTDDQRSNLAILRENRNFSHFHLPANPSLGLAEAYVDLRRVTTISQELLHSDAKKSSLTEDAIKALQRQLLLYWIHRELL